MGGPPQPQDDPGGYIWDQRAYLQHQSDAKKYERAARKSAARGDRKKAEKLSRESARSGTLAKLFGERMSRKRKN